MNNPAFLEAARVSSITVVKVVYSVLIRADGTECIHFPILDYGDGDGVMMVMQAIQDDEPNLQPGEQLELRTALIPLISMPEPLVKLVN